MNTPAAKQVLTEVCNRAIEHGEQPITEIKPTMHTWDVYWSPEGRKIATVQAAFHVDAIRKAPQPYRKYLGELYAEIRKGGE